MRTCHSMTLILAFFLLLSCSSKETMMDEPAIQDTGMERKYTPPVAEKPDRLEMDFKRAFFDTAQSVLKPHGKKALKQAAEWLKAHPGTHVQIEGYCDERGSFEYNRALGERRAKAAQAYLISQGIDPSRLSIYSGGEVPGTSHEEMAKNRNAGLVLIYEK